MNDYTTIQTHLRHLVSVLIILSMLTIGIGCGRTNRLAILDEDVERLYAKVDSLRFQGKWAETLETLDSIISLSKDNNIAAYLHALDHAANASFFHQDYERMLGYIEVLFETDKPDSLKFNDMNAYLTLVDFNVSNHRYEESHFYLDCADSLLRSCLNKGAAGKRFQSVSDVIYFEKMQEALVDSDYNTLGRLLSEIAPNRFLSITNTALLAVYKTEYYMGIGDSKKGIDELKRLLNDTTIIFQLRYDMLQRYMELRLSQGNAALSLAEEEEFFRTRSYVETPKIRYLESDVYAQLGDTARAYDLFVRAKQLDDSIKGAYNKAYSKDLGDRFEIRRRNMELSRQKSENLRKTGIISVLMLLAVALTVIVVVYLRRYRNKNEEFSETVRSLGERNGELMSASMSLRDMKNREERLHAIIKSDNSASDKLNAIRQAGNAVGIAGSKHLCLELADETVLNLVAQLKKRHPDLSNAELRIAPMVMMNWSNKDIATYLNRSPSTVKYTKYQLRKKLAIEEPTEEYLKRLSTQISDSLNQD